MPSRRNFMADSAGAAALAAAAAARTTGAASPHGAANAAANANAGSPRITIREVTAHHVYINERSQGLYAAPEFTSDTDPRRWHYGGPFEQLPSAVIAIIKTDQGVTGFGMGAGGGAAVEIIHGHLRHLLIGANPLQVERLWDQLYSSALFYGRRGVFAMALSAVDNALWDIAGKHAGKTVHQLLGGSAEDRIELYQTGGDIAAGRAQGIRNFKLGLFIGPQTPPAQMEAAIAAVRRARETMGPTGNLMTDCVSRTGTVEWAVRFAERVRDARLYFMEELLSPDDVFGYVELVRRIGGAGPGWTRVAHGEHEYTHHGFKVLTRLAAAEVLQPDITWCGGLTAARRIADLVEGAGLELIPHRGGSLWGLPIALTAPSCTMAESFPAGSPLLDAMRPLVQNGLCLAPTGTGFGTALTEQMVLEHRLER